MRLLVSVRNRNEVSTALDGGADFIDVKEPGRGSLGRAHPDTWNQVAAAVNRKVPVSVALGELMDKQFVSFNNPINGIEFAKIGLAGCSQISDWKHRWYDALASFPNQTKAVAVAYADWQAAQAPDPEEILQCAINVGCEAFLIDTYMKNGAGLFDYLSNADLHKLIDRARKNRMMVVLAGSLTKQTIPLALSLGPDMVAVRGAACKKNRSDSLDLDRVQELAVLLTHNNPLKAI